MGPSVKKDEKYRYDSLSNKASTQIVLDTNFIISMLRQRRDLEAEIKTAVPGLVKIVVSDLVLLELERLARKGSGNVVAWANAAISLLERRNYTILEHRPGPTDVDASLVELALTEKSTTAIATIDRQLRGVLKVFNIPSIWPTARHGLLTRSVHISDLK